MKKIEALIRTSKFEEVHACLTELDVKFLTFFEVKGIGMENAKTQSYRGSDFNPGYIPRTKLEMVVTDEQVDKIVDCILHHACTKQVGDGKIFVSPIESAYRIRNKDRDHAAL
ncbi:P-II family nitrogen regulator [Litoribacter ruber]|uniref:P-II family nitrogen regulator n=1 Tax=Litoribacter ruber TaxID=702568 RepID=A0AAP2CJQ4_9BACT|nr:MULTISPECIES: P-II family nitrogen regulator [Litoribacter]MBS9523830.1 P-II family nitrogen regulator [Litoribacter alkaliphilus]MBT0811575.1 P-II family nitrogen regulator [Litoribacter ruber]